MPTNFIHKLQQQLQLPLPGQAAQFKLAPPARKLLNDIDYKKLNPRLSAVMLLIYIEEEKEKIILIKRPQYDGVHSGQIALPGGKFEEEDKELSITALRETKEEIGIEPEHIKLLGHLSDIYIPPSNFYVKPFVGYLTASPTFKPSEREVEAIHSIDRKLINDNKIENKIIQLANGLSFNTPSYNIHSLSIWGATAMILAEFAEITKTL